MTSSSKRSRGLQARRLWLPVLPFLSLPALAPTASAHEVTPVAAVAPRMGGMLLGRTPVAPGTITGRVVDETGQPVVAAQIAVVGTTTGTVTDDAGNFTIRNVPSGSHTLRVSRIGFAPKTELVAVPDGGTVTVNVTLEHAATRLEEVITTATGQQSRRQFGNAVATLPVDSIAKTAPVTTVNELLQGRTAGVQVVQGAGQTGASSSIRIRGTSSLSLTNEPLIIVDGIRYNNDPAPESGVGGFTNTIRENRFQFNPDEIESMDVLKGPSAAALYGTAAANGVIVIRTKRGTTGSAKWTVFGETGLVQQPAQYDANYTSWGHNAKNQTVQCKIYQAAQNQCTIDSLTTFNPWTSPQTNPFADGNRGVIGAQVSGGSDFLRYFFSAQKQQETGPYKMPDSEIARITQERGTAPDPAQVRPNRLAEAAFRGNFTMQVAKNASLDLSAGYVDRALRTPFDGAYFGGITFQMITAPGYKTATNGTQREYVGDVMSIRQQNDNSRFTGSIGMNYQPLTWLQTRAVVGLDQTNSYGARWQLAGQGTKNSSVWGPTSAQGYSGIDGARSAANKYTVDLGATATHDLPYGIGSRSSIGAQWYKDELYESDIEGYGLAPGAMNPNAAQQRAAWEFTTENATYGAFVEEQLSHQDRLFVTLGVRTDQNSAFGRSVGNTVYPRAAVSYVISEEPWFPTVPSMSNLRLRAAWGKAGVQPGTTAALAYLRTDTYPVNGVETPGLRLTSIGNAALKPEVTTETELGADAGFLHDRVTLEATYFNKRSQDALYQRPIPPSYGAGSSVWENIAAVQNKGFELTLDAQLVQQRLFSWGLHLNGSRINNKLLDSGTVSLPKTQGARNVEGYPLFGLWDRPYTYSDKNGDGIIVPSEITLGSADAFKGSTLPKVEAGINNTFGFFNDRIRINTLFDYRGGFYNQWGYAYQRCVSSGNCDAVNDPKSPLWLQAASVAAATPSLGNTRWGFFVPNDFVRFRELSATYTMPDNWASRYLHGRTASLTLSGRNLGLLWSRYPGVDPEANASATNTGGGNNDFYVPPVLRYWTAKVNIGF